jgi:protoporphyrinogen oxidase
MTLDTAWTADAPEAREFSRLREGDHIAVIGGGPAGLTIAYLLAKRGFAVTVVEGTDMVGGISQTARYKGYRFDIGGHRFFTKISPVQALWEELLGDDFIDVPRLSRIHYGGKYFNYPLKAFNALAGLGLINATRIIASYLKVKMYPSPIEDTFEQWVSNRFGKRLYEIFFKTYTEKVWGIPCTEIRAEWAAQRIQGLSLARAILSATALTRRNNSIKSLIDTFKYPRLGPGQMWEACRDRIEALGGRVLMGHWVNRVELEDGRATAIVATSEAGETRIEADHVISTTDIRSLVRTLGDAAPAAVQASAEGLRYRDFLVVALILDRENLFPDNWIYVHTPGVKVGRIQNFNNWSAAMVPDAGRTCLGMEYFCFEGDGLWASSDAELQVLASRELEALGLAKASDVVDGTVVRMPKAYPIYDSQYRGHLDGVRAFIDRIPNMHTVGRNGMHKYNNQDHSMYTAILTLENMLGTARHDVWAVNTDFEYHEEQRVDPNEKAETGGRTA